MFSICSNITICLKEQNFNLVLTRKLLLSQDRVRVANELGAGNGKGAKFATIVSVMTSIVIGLFFWVLIMIFHNELALIFTNSKPVLTEVNKLAILLALTVLLNSVQPILSGNFPSFLLIFFVSIFFYGHYNL